MRVKLPHYAEPLFKPKRYKGLRGGRGSAKSHTIARVLLMMGKKKPLRILCAREFQNSIRESVHKLLSDVIYEYGLQSHYNVTLTSITGKNGTEFIFKGLHGSLMSIKSMEGIDILWLEEAQTISKYSWDVLIPTIRKEGSEIWASFNPENEDDPTYVRFVNENGESINNENMLSLEVNWDQNPWFPDTLRIEKDYLYEVDPDLADHVWGGKCRSNSDAQIFRGKYAVRSFEVDPSWLGPYLGVDWGFSTDPSVMIEMYINPAEKELMIRREAHGYHVEIDDLPELFDHIPTSRNVVSRGDNSRPETISYLKRQGFPIEPCTKWKGSVEDGIEFLRTFRKIVVHPDCPKTLDECKWYSYKVDKLTGEVTTIIVDAHNHCFDAIRYGLEPLITAEGFGILGVL